MTSRALVDTGPLVALLNGADPHHDRCVETFRKLSPPLWTCWPVLTEAAYLLETRPVVARRLLGEVDGGFLRLLPLDADDVRPIQTILRRYEDQRFQLADAALMHLSEREGIDRVFTLDRKDFTVFRKTSGQPLVLLPERLG